MPTFTERFKASLLVAGPTMLSEQGNLEETFWKCTANGRSRKAEVLGLAVISSGSQPMLGLAQVRSPLGLRLSPSISGRMDWLSWHQEQERYGKRHRSAPTQGGQVP